MQDLENHTAFLDAVDELENQGFGLADVAVALGVSHQYVRATAKSRRNVLRPDVWRPALCEMARRRASALTDLVERLEMCEHCGHVPAEGRQGGTAAR